jgi:hypothetical protein
MFNTEARKAAREKFIGELLEEIERFKNQIGPRVAVVYQLSMLLERLSYGVLHRNDNLPPEGPVRLPLVQGVVGKDTIKWFGVEDFVREVLFPRIKQFTHQGHPPIDDVEELQTFRVKETYAILANLHKHLSIQYSDLYDHQLDIVTPSFSLVR